MTAPSEQLRALPDAPPDSTRHPVRRTRVSRATKIDYWLDAILLVAFLLDESLHFTGLSAHEWVGLGFAPALLVHLTLHWDWVLRTTRRVVTRLPARERLRWIVDLALLLAMTLCVASGLLISRVALPALGIHLSDDGFWTGLHTTMADICLVLVGLHVGLSWRWIVLTTRRLSRRTHGSSR